MLVGVGAGLRAKSLLHAAREYASHRGGQWFAVSVETPESLTLLEQQTRAENLVMARQLGAEVILATGSHVGRTLLRVAQEHHISLLILGKPSRLSSVQLWGDASPVEWLQRNSGALGILLLPTVELPAGVIGPILGVKPDLSSRAWRDYAGAALVAGMATLVSLLVEPFVGYWSVALIYLLGVTVGGVSLKRSPTLVLATISGLLWNWLFIPPRFTFYISRPQDLMMFSMFFVVALTVGHLTARLAKRERMERRLEVRARALYQLTRQLAAARSQAEVVEIVVHQVRAVFDLDSFVVLSTPEARHCPIPVPFGGAAASESELQFIRELHESGCSGANAGGRQSGSLLCLPLIVSQRMEGVLAVRIQQGAVLEPGQHELLDAFAAQLAIVFEIQRLAQEERRVKWLAESERLQKTLFDSVSHELKTPIAAIRVALEQPVLDVVEVRRANDRLRRSVEHLLNASRIESGLIKPARVWCDPVDIIHDAMALSQTQGGIAVSTREPLPFLLVDAGLAAQSLATLLENALLYGGRDPAPLLEVREEGGFIQFSVSDHGPGIPFGEEERIFEKFYRLPGSRPGGVGLGLAIARSFAQIQGGSLAASQRGDDGSVITLKLPVGGRPQLPE